ncbi:GD10369 [Drosophila simulans]|uniref:GD10369 n=1 Tax=Drosophila simulans TaxID=7240 RepID=B4QC31_DROSI|nr:GD10369 [Drosophila simulans]
MENFRVRVGRRYQTGLLWKDGHVVLPQSYEVGYKRMTNIEKKLKRKSRWRRDSDDERDPDVYEMKVMTFGGACLPSAAHYVKTLKALKFRDSETRAFKAITDYHYVDDYVDSSSSPTMETAFVPRDPDEILGHEDEACDAESHLIVQRVQVAASAADAAENGTPSERQTGCGWIAIQIYRIGLLWAAVGECVPSQGEETTATTSWELPKEGSTKKQWRRWVLGSCSAREVLAKNSAHPPG